MIESPFFGKPVPTNKRIPLKKLRQHVNILFYSNCILYEDDLRDLGEVEYSVKIVRMDVASCLVPNLH